MKCYFVILLLAAVCYTIHGNARMHRCGKNEVYKECVDCEKKCNNDSMECFDYCYEGCSCDPSKYRRHNGACVPKEQCQSLMQCRSNEYYTSCHGCEARCGGRTFICPRVCQKGCYCDPRFFRRLYGRCVPMEMCPRRHHRPGKPVFRPRRD